MGLQGKLMVVVLGCFDTSHKSPSVRTSLKPFPGTRGSRGSREVDMPVLVSLTPGTLRQVGETRPLQFRLDRQRENWRVEPFRF